MNEIKCPHCNTVFTINENEYNQLLSQIRGVEFDKELHDRLMSEKLILEERSKYDLDKKLSEKEQTIQELRYNLSTIEKNTNHLIQNKVNEKEQEILKLEKTLSETLAKKDQDFQEQLLKKNEELLQLKNQLDKVVLEKDVEFETKTSILKQERDQLKNQILLQEKENELSITTVKQSYENQLKAANEQVEFYKNFKAQQSTKAIGESLELFAETEFNKVRQFAFPNAYFEKDNQISDSRSKGDYIYRESDENGVEFLSIMFEMKNEADTTARKHKNEDFFKELDKDRKEKKCEYAVLVSMLEPDNDYYNTGIVDVSYKYEKMYVVRPQLFIQFIGILRNAALSSLKYKQELAQIKEQNIDITHFEEDLEVFKTAFAKNYTSASNNFKKAIEQIDKTIKQMEAVKASLTTSENQLRLANNKLDDVSVKKLTRKNPTMREKFESLKR
ncbi:MAG: DUF2130 domain-containing protein [Streptococcus sp.]|nr:DUF2130 domain-containing protein [Streptococcus sp.]